MSRHQIDYESLAQDAMRGLVRTVLARVAKGGLPGDHHFYISFHTRGTGVAVSKRLLERYPDEMTIVLQNKFSDLKAFDERFEVTLWFDSIPERLVIPYTSIKVFFDPSVPFGHQFEVAESPAPSSAATPGPRLQAERRVEDRSHVTTMTSSTHPRARQGGRPDAARPSAPAPSTAKPPAPVVAQPAVKPATKDEPSIGFVDSEAKPPSGRPAPKAAPASEEHAPAKSSTAKPEPLAGDAATAGDGAAAADPDSKVIPLDAFRKKS